MKRLFILSAALLAVSVNAAPPATLSAGQQHALVANYVGCLAGKQPKLLIDYAADIDRRDDDYAKLGDPACVRAAGYRDFRTMRVFDPAISGAIAERSVARLTDFGFEAGFAAAPPLAHAKLLSAADYLAKGRMSRSQFDAHVVRSNSERAIGMLAECVARAKPAEARSVFTAPFGSPAEVAAIQSVLPAVSTCLPGGSVKLKPEQLRTALAVQYFRLALSAQPGLKEKLL